MQLLLGLVAPVTLVVALSVQAEMQVRVDEIATLRERMARLEGLFEGFTKREAP